MRTWRRAVPSHRQARRWAAALVGLVATVALAMLGTAGPASAHDVLVSSSPANGDVLNAAPSAVSFTFNDPIQNFNPILEILGPNGNNFATAAPTIDGTSISVPFAAGPAGNYRAIYRIVSADGHPVAGQITFTLTDTAAGQATGTPPQIAATQTAAAATAATGQNAANNALGGSSSGGGTGSWLLVGIGIVAVIALIMLVGAKRKPGSGPHQQ